MNHAKIFKGWSPRDARSEWYQIVPRDHFVRVQMKKPSSFSKKNQYCMILCGVSDSGAEQDFKYLYWTISKTLVWNLFTSKGAHTVEGTEKCSEQFCLRSVLNVHNLSFAGYLNRTGPVWPKSHANTLYKALWRCHYAPMQNRLQCRPLASSALKWMFKTCSKPFPQKTCFEHVHNFSRTVSVCAVP